MSAAALAAPAGTAPSRRDARSRRIAAPALRAAGVVAAAIAAWLATDGWDHDGRAVAAVFGAATAGWLLTRVDDTVIAIGAGLALVLAGALPADGFLAALGDDTVWLLIGSCVLAAGLTSSGVVERAAAALIGRARSVRALAHLTTAALVLTAFAVPSTSGRAALAVPVFRGLAQPLASRRLQVGFSLLFPAVILLSAMASLLGAGAHLIAAELIRLTTGDRVDFLLWAALGLPVALVSCAVATEVMLFGFLERRDRRVDVTEIARALRARHRSLHGVRPSAAEWRALAVLVIVIVLWATEPLHGLPAAIVAMAGAIAVLLPAVGVVAPKPAFAAVPWSLLLFLAATLALGSALVSTGAADRLADAALGALGGGTPFAALFAIVLVSAGAHLVVPSRSARATVLLPVVLPLAAAAGLNPTSAALASTAAAGFCLTLTSSAKPVALFSDVEGVACFDRRELLAFALLVAPFAIATVLVAAVFLWPLLGVPAVI
ncbi:SLC13 family permease [Microbacterium sp. NPDC055683]